MNITINRFRQHADLCMPVSLRASVMTTGAPVAGIAPAAGQKSVLVTGAFVGASAWSPPI